MITLTLHDSIATTLREYAEKIRERSGPQGNAALLIAGSFADVLDEAARRITASEPGARRCAATISTDPPQDCDAPFCGCNPEWHKVIEMLQECGWKSPQELRTTAESPICQHGPSCERCTKLLKKIKALLRLAPQEIEGRNK